jgi:hypothetical protein
MDLKTAMERLQNLLNRAEHPNTPGPEADLCRQRAEELMRKYRIAEEDLIASDPTALTPVLDFITVCGDTSMQRWYTDLMWYVADHAGVRTFQKWERTPGGYEVRAGVVGYEADIRLVQMIYGAARLAFQSLLEPGVDRSLSDAENVYRLRSSGMTRRNVAKILWGLDTHAAHAKAGTLYKEECAKRGETPALAGRGTDVETYREAYARGFVAQLARRLRRSRDAADSSGGAIVLHGRKERVEEAFYGFFPELKPSPLPAEKETAPAKTKVRKPTKAERAAYHRKHFSAAANAGESAGTRAANEVELSRPAPAQRVEA